jgi:pimeloyl-ACP methyl ester carboxylesterase
LTGWKRRVTRLAVAAVTLYVIACVAATVVYRRFLYPAPVRESTMPADSKPLVTTATDNVPVGGLSWDGDARVVFFHGNGELAEDNADLARELASHGYAVTLAEYRGYGISRAAGAPTERGLYADAEAVLRALATPRDKLVLMGFSLGTGVAVEMAARGYGRAIVLLAPYTSIPAVAQHWVPFLPMGLIMRDKFDTQSKASKIDLPVLVAHGDADEVVPFDMGETVAHTFPKGRLVTVPGAHHTDMFAKDEHLMQKIINFLIEVMPL